MIRLPVPPQPDYRVSEFDPYKKILIESLIAEIQQKDFFIESLQQPSIKNKADIQDMRPETGVIRRPQPSLPIAKDVPQSPTIQPENNESHSPSLADTGLAFMAAGLIGNKDRMGYMDAMVGSRPTIISFEKKLVDDLTHGMRPGQAPFQARGVRIGLGYGSIKYEWGANGFRRFDLQAGPRTFSLGAAFSRGEGARRFAPYMRVATRVDQRVKVYMGLNPETKTPRIDHLSSKESTLARTVAGNGIAKEIRLPAPKAREIGKIIGKGTTSMGVDFLFFTGAGGLLDLIGLDSDFQGRGAVQLMTGLVMRETTKAVITKVKDGKLADGWGKQTMCSIAEGAIALHLHESFGRMLSDVSGIERGEFNFGMHVAQFAMMWGTMAFFNPALKQCRQPEEDTPPPVKPALKKPPVNTKTPDDPQVEIEPMPMTETETDIPQETNTPPAYVPQNSAPKSEQLLQRVGKRASNLRYLQGARRTLYSIPTFIKRP